MKIGSLISGILYMLFMIFMCIVYLMFGVAFGIGEGFAEANGGTVSNVISSDVFMLFMFASAILAVLALVAGILVFKKPTGATVLFSINVVLYAIMAIVSMVALKTDIMVFVLYIPPFILGVLAITFAALSRKKKKAEEEVAPTEVVTPDGTPFEMKTINNLQQDTSNSNNE